MEFHTNYVVEINNYDEPPTEVTLDALQIDTTPGKQVVIGWKLFDSMMTLFDLKAFFSHHLAEICAVSQVSVENSDESLKRGFIFLYEFVPSDETEKIEDFLKTMGEKIQEVYGVKICCQTYMEVTMRSAVTHTEDERKEFFEGLTNDYKKLAKKYDGEIGVPDLEEIYQHFKKHDEINIVLLKRN